MTASNRRNSSPIHPSPLPIWSLPFLVVLWGIVLYVGHLPLGLALGSGLPVMGTCVYAIWRSRSPVDQRPVSNVLSLLPGHLLLLLGLTWVRASNGWIALWILVPVLSVAYDAVSLLVRNQRLRTSTATSLYAILWAVLFVLLERLVAIGRALEGGEEIIVAAVIGVFGVAFISLGTYRHLRIGKE